MLKGKLAYSSTWKSTLGNVMVLRDKETKEEVFELLILLDNRQKKDRIISQSLQRRDSSKNSGYIRVIAVDVQDQNFFCSASNIRVLMEPFNYSLQELIQKQEAMAENDLWKVLLDVCEAFSSDCQLKIVNNFIHPKAILYVQKENRFKLLNGCFFSETNLDLSKSLQSHYCSPETYNQLLLREEEHVVNQDQENIFSLGMIMLHLCLLQDFDCQ